MKRKLFRVPERLTVLLDQKFLGYRFPVAGSDQPGSITTGAMCIDSIASDAVKASTGWKSRLKTDNDKLCYRRRGGR
jgi:hypothetical protein